MKSPLRVVGILMIVLGIIACQKNSPAEPLLEFGSVSDVEGNVYKTVKIGDQWWMAENLRVTKFADGAPLTFINRIGTDSLWSNLDSAAYTVINDTLFGYLYNFAAVSNDSHAIAPTGWHIATDEDWKLLESFLGMSEQEVNALGFRGVNEAEKLVSKYSVGWPEDGILFGSDKVGFNAKPGGCRLFNGIFSEQSNMAFWWTATPEGSGEAWYRYIDSNDKRIFRQHTYTRYGMSIRCVKD